MKREIESEDLDDGLGESELAIKICKLTKEYIRIDRELNNSLPEYLNLIKEVKKGAGDLTERLKTLKFKRNGLKKRRRHIRQGKLIYKEGFWVKNEEL